jgi:hypothetical protein
MSGEVWYAVGPRDVFPETFGPFLLGNNAVREVFMKHHGDLLDAAFWQATRSASRPATCTTYSPMSATSASCAGRPQPNSPPLQLQEKTMSDSIVIVGAARTPMGGFQGDFSSLAAHDLGGAAIKAAVERSGVSPELVTEVLFGNCLMAGQGQAPARQAAFKGGLPKSAGAVTLSKMCGSGMKAAMFAHDMLLAGSHDVMVAGGMESMTNAPTCCSRAAAASASATTASMTT